MFEAEKCHQKHSSIEHSAGTVAMVAPRKISRKVTIEAWLADTLPHEVLRLSPMFSLGRQAMERSEQFLENAENCAQLAEQAKGCTDPLAV